MKLFADLLQLASDCIAVAAVAAPRRHIAPRAAATVMGGEPPAGAREGDQGAIRLAAAPRAPMPRLLSRRDEKAAAEGAPKGSSRRRRELTEPRSAWRKELHPAQKIAYPSPHEAGGPPAARRN